MADAPKPFTWIGLSGAIPEIEALRAAGSSELGTRLVVARLAARLFEAGSGIIYGSHPTFIPLVEAAFAAVPQLAMPTKMIAMFVARRFLPTDADEDDFRRAHELCAEIVCTGSRDQERNPALTEMRQRMIDACDALICVGGKLHADGNPPGVDEEAGLALQHGKPVYLVGAGGGRALQIFQERFGADSAALHNGLTHEENRLLAATLDPWQATTLVLKGLRNRHLLQRIAAAPEQQTPSALANTPGTGTQELLQPAAHADRLAPSGEVSMHTLEHLKMIQGIINRLAGNSFSIKGWSLTLVAAILAFTAGKDARLSTIPFAVATGLPVLFFWGLDAYYLNLERRFRRLYTAILKEAQRPVAERKIELFSMELAPIAAEVETVWGTACRGALSYFYLPLLCAVLLACSALLLFHGAKTDTGQNAAGKPTASVPSGQR